MTFISKSLQLAGTAVFCAMAATGHAGPVTLTFGSQLTGAALGQANGTELPAESLIRFGYFTIPLEQVAAGLNDLSLLNSNFIQLAATRIGYFGGSTVLDDTGSVVSVEETNSPYEAYPGLFGHTLSYDPEALGLMAMRYYLWVVDAPELSGATQHGLFSDADWVSPSFSTETYDVSTVSPVDPMDLFAADRGPELSSVQDMGPLNKLRLLDLTPVPEPQLPLLLLTAATALGLRRRRAHSLDS